MSGSVKGRIDRIYEMDLRADERQQAKNKPLITESITDFCKNKLGFTPYSYQTKLMLDPGQFIAARWCRQSGKSHTIAAMLLHQALSKPGSRMVVLAPALRQAKKIISKISNFTRILAEQGLDVMDASPTKTRLDLRNGSSIEALPNNPSTIRGETTHIIFVDEMNYIQNDEELYEAIVYSLNTTNERMIATSTPGSTDSLFFKMCTDDDKFGDVSRHHVTYKEALEPNGPLKLKIVEKLERQNRDDPSRWTREMMAEFAEDTDAWFPLSLITRCVSNEHEVFDDSALLLDGFSRTGTFYVGCDLGKKHDHSAVAVVEKEKDGTLRLVHLKRFKLGTEYGSVLGYLRQLNQQLQTVRTIEIDQTGVGEYFVEDAIKSGIKNAQGTMLTLPMKQQIMVLTKKKMEEGKLLIHYDWELINEINIERYELTKTGQIQFSHPNGTHDDRLWAIALAVQASRPEVPEYHPVVVLGRNPNSLMPRIDWRRFRPGARTYTPRPGDPPGVVSHGILYCWFCRLPVLTRPHVCKKPPN
jgi:phage FluMu gp28-like protein